MCRKVLVVFEVNLQEKKNLSLKQHGASTGRSEQIV